MEKKTVDTLPKDPAVTITLRGVSRSGKTHWMKEFCKNIPKLWPETKIRLVVFVSPVPNDDVVECLHSVFPDTELRVEKTLKMEHLQPEYLGDPDDGLAIMLLDDLGCALHNNKPLEQLFIGVSSHQRLLAILTVHSFYESSSQSFRTTIHNSCYLVCMQDSRAFGQLTTLSRQIFGNGGFLPACLEDQKRDYGGEVGAHIVIDTRAACDTDFRVFSNILGNKRPTVAYCI